MKLTPWILRSALAPGLVAASHAATILIDGSTLNGSFEAGSGTASATSWTAGATSGHVLERQTNAHTGTYSLVVGTNAANTMITSAAMNTGYSIVAGDVFSLSFFKKGAFNADPTDSIGWKLFYTSTDTLAGTPTILFSGDAALPGSTGLVTTSPWSEYSYTSTAAGSGVGKILFLAFTPGTGLVADEFARVDSVVLSVVPEPAHATLGVFGLALSCLVRRRKRA